METAVRPFSLIDLDLIKLGMDPLSLLFERNNQVPVFLLVPAENEDTAIALLDHGVLDYCLKQEDDLSRIITAIRRAERLWQAMQSREEAEISLQELRTIYGLLIETTQEYIVLHDFEGRILYANPAFVEFSGYSMDQILSSNLAMFIPEDQFELLIQNRDRRIHGEVSRIKYEIDVYLANGSRIPLQASSSPILRGDKAVGILFTASNIFVQKTSQTALRESEDRYRNLIATMEQGLALHEVIQDDQGKVIDYRFLDVNDSYLKQTGFSREILGKTVLEVLPGVELSWIEKYGRVALSGEPLNFEDYVASLDKYFEVNAFCPAPKQFAVICSDITDRHKMEAAIMFSENRYRSIIETANEGFLQLDANHHITQVNQKMAEMLGYTQEEMFHRPVTEFFFDGEEEDFYRELFFRKQGKSGRYERKYLHKNGSIIWAIVSVGANLSDSNEYQGQFALVTDISEQKRTQQALQQRIYALTQPFDQDLPVDLTDLFNLEELQKLQDLFAKSTGVASVITRPDGTPITQPSNFCSLCIDIIRKTDIGLKNCYLSDAYIGRQNPQGPLMQPCLSGGLWDAGASITVGGKHIANWLIGQIRNEGQDEKNILAYAQSIGANAQLFKEALDNVPVMPLEQFETIAQMVFLLSNELSIRAYQNIQQARFIAEKQKTELALSDSLRQTKLHVQELQLLHQIDRAMTNHETIEQVITTILGQIITLAPIQAGVVYLPETNSQNLKLITSVNFPTELAVHLAKTENRNCITAVMHNQKIIIEDNLDQVVDRNCEVCQSYYSVCTVVPLLIGDQLKGVLQIFASKNMGIDMDWRSFITSLGLQVAIAIDRMELFAGMKKANADLESAYDATLEGWSRALELRERETAGHSQRVVELTMRLGEAFGLKQAEMVHLRRGALLHDIGKMGISDNLLLKPGKLSTDEWIIMRKHPEFAYQLLNGIPYLRPAIDIPYYHHEKWDGSGYPRGLKGTEIPLPARIFALVDVWDALSNSRPYRPDVWSETDILHYIKDNRGTHFDPMVVEKFMEIIAVKSGGVSFP
jgi:PAS domain S-box-containing protein